jgi:hypothetical protein
MRLTLEALRICISWHLVPKDTDSLPQM